MPVCRRRCTSEYPTRTCLTSAVSNWRMTQCTLGVDTWMEGPRPALQMTQPNHMALGAAALHCIQKGSESDRLPGHAQNVISTINGGD
jgi:hypothetical protein